MMQYYPQSYTIELDFRTDNIWDDAQYYKDDLQVLTYLFILNQKYNDLKHRWCFLELNQFFKIGNIYNYWGEEFPTFEYNTKEIILQTVGKQYQFKQKYFDETFWISEVSNGIILCIDYNNLQIFLVSEYYITNIGSNFTYTGDSNFMDKLHILLYDIKWKFDNCFLDVSNYDFMNYNNIINRQILAKESGEISNFVASTDKVLKIRRLGSDWNTYLMTK